ncbi:bacteriophage abortive infection AbiH family protein [Pedobacter hartonius]|uniref:Bacteriophage abortive infection AbiH n=1 Tax=Pedobacter hartonius TaxID=425514 RepID=A0A1H4HK76_9SPHI|nr:bacteriophage abortive infection AbiH family protein [Pedobacter hartonius]SEB22091.1 Bacteriophage abortive infection AbiH [Pedobacter hartonius]
MKNLYIIGNGFDIHHSLNTRYSDFHNFVSNNNNDLENALEEYFDFSVDYKYLWKNFEAELYRFNYKSFFNDNNHIDHTAENFKVSDTYDLADGISEEAENLIEMIREGFTDWIISLDYPSKESILKRLIFLKGNSAFINFNYTDTLEEYYGIAKSQILYIHNNANEQFGELIFGHGELNETDPAEDELDEEGNSSRTLFSDGEAASRRPFYELQKDTEAILTEHKAFLKKLTDVESIIVLGHSLGAVDWPYFKRINEIAPNAQWKISYYMDSEKETIGRIAIDEINIGRNKLRMVRIDDLD